MSRASSSTRKWTDQSGQERYTTEVVIPRFGGALTMLDGRSGGGGEAGAGAGAGAGMDDDMGRRCRQQRRRWPSGGARQQGRARRRHSVLGREHDRAPDRRGSRGGRVVSCSKPMPTMPNVMGRGCLGAFAGLAWRRQPADCVAPRSRASAGQAGLDAVVFYFPPRPVGRKDISARMGLAASFGRGFVIGAWPRPVASADRMVHRACLPAGCSADRASHQRSHDDGAWPL